MFRAAQRPLFALTILLSLGFDWPSRSAQLVRALTAAETPRERRDALRRIDELDGSLAAEAVRPLLSNHDPEVRAEALRVLGRAAADATPELVAAFTDQAPEVRAVAVGELGRRTQPLHTPLLLRGAADPEPRVRIASLRALAQSDEESAFATLSAGLSDPVLEVRTAAIQAMAARPEPEARATLLRAFEGALPELRSAILDALGSELTGRTELTLAMALDDPDEQVVLAALRSYARASTPVPSARITSLSSSASPQVAAAASSLLARTTTDSTRNEASAAWLPALERTAERPLSAERSAAVLAELEQTLPSGETMATDALVEWLTHAPATLRPRIVALIARSAGELRASAIVPLLTTEAAPVRRALVRLLAQARDAAAAPALERALDDPDAQVRAAAGDVLSQRLDRRLVVLLGARLYRAHGTERDELTRILANGLPKLSPPLAAAQCDELCDSLQEANTSDVRATSLALRALGGIDHVCARRRIHEAMRDPRTPVRIAALRASVRDHRASARALREAAFGARDANVAATALIAATVASDPLTRAQLQALREQENWPLGPAVAFALASARGAVVSDHELCDLAASHEPATRSNALVALARRASLACPHTIDRLLATSSAWPVRHAAAVWAHARAQSAGGEPEHDVLLRCKERDHDAHVRAACAGKQGLSIAPPAADHARALVLRDARVLISLPDGSGNVAWPDLPAIASLPAWFAPYMRE